MRIGVLISGRGSHLKNLIDSCASGKIAGEIALVISNNPDAPGLQYAADADIESVVLPHTRFPSREEYDTELVTLLQEKNVDLVCLAGFMRLLSPVFIHAFPNRIMNVHPSLLPAFPGIHAQKQAVEYGVRLTGVTVHFVDQGLDSGPVILQRAVEVLDTDTEESLSQRLLPVEHAAYREAVQLFAQNRLQIRERKVIVKAKGKRT